MASSPVVLITGATGSLGREMALGFAKLGYVVAFTSRGGNSAAALENDCREVGATDVVAITVDLTDEAASQHVASSLRAAGYSPRVLVNNARNTAFLKAQANGYMPAGNWLGEYSLGVIVPYQLTLALLAEEKVQLESVINIASMYGVVAPNQSLYTDPAMQSPINYGVVKAGLIHLSRELAVRLSPRGVRVNSISFGGVEGRVDEAFKQRYAALCPSGKMLSRNEVFGPVQFLASDASSGMTGHNLIVDGGWSTW